MRIERGKRWFQGICFIVVSLWAAIATAQTYNSGSTGTLPLNPTASITLNLPADGILNYTNVTIPAGITVTFNQNTNNTPVTILATGDVNIAGVISVNGVNGRPISETPNLGSAGGPGGFAGGSGGTRSANPVPGANGLGPGGGARGINGIYGAPVGFDSLIPLFGGSGGGGGGTFPGNPPFAGASGGGGGGAIAIVSSTRIVLTGSVTANGGDGGPRGAFITCDLSGGAGSGGAIRLVAPEITGTGSLAAVNGNFGCSATSTSSGIVRLEAFNLTYTGASTPMYNTSASPGPVTAASTPPLINLPTLSITSVGGIASSANPTGSYTSADISLPATAVNPVPVNLTATNTPVGTVFTVRLIPQFAPKVDVTSAPSTGTFSSSTTTSNVSFPVGQVSLINAFASFTLTAQVASLYPLIDGEPVERIMLAANYGGPSTVTLITKSGKKVTADQLLRGGR